MSDEPSTFDTPALLRLATGAVNGWLVLLIGAQGAAIGAALIGGALAAYEWTSSYPRVDTGVYAPWAMGSFALGVGLGGGAVAGWRVLGGLRGAGRAAFVVAIGLACGWGTLASPLLVEQRLAHSWPMGVAAAFMAAAAGGVAMLQPGRPRPPIEEPSREPGVVGPDVAP